MGSGRDLLYKPQTPIVMPDEAPEAKSGKKGAARPGVRVRDLGGVAIELPAGRTVERAREADRTTAAYKAAYFNKDVSGLHEINQRQSQLQALRGAQGAADLRKVVLPPAIGVDSPDPAQLRGASDLMGLDGSHELSLESMIGRQGAWAKGEGVTVEMLKARLKRLAEMVEARKVALRRMLQGRAKKLTASVTLRQAQTFGGNALDQIQDVVAAGRTLINETAEQANAMHLRIAKTLGIKVKQS
jgi:hypothetical protein